MLGLVGWDEGTARRIVYERGRHGAAFFVTLVASVKPVGPSPTRAPRSGQALSRRYDTTRRTRSRA